MLSAAVSGVEHSGWPAMSPRRRREGDPPPYYGELVRPTKLERNRRQEVLILALGFPIFYAIRPNLVDMLCFCSFLNL